MSVILCKNSNDHKRISIHRMVALAFIENPNSFEEINHIDENPQNNCVENLEWCTRLYNMNYGTLPTRLNKKRMKPVVGVKEDGTVLEFDAVRHGKKEGFDASGISKSIKTKKPYKGVFWRYKYEFTGKGETRGA